MGKPMKPTKKAEAKVSKAVEVTVENKVADQPEQKPKPVATNVSVTFATAQAVLNAAVKHVTSKPIIARAILAHAIWAASGGTHNTCPVWQTGTYSGKTGAGLKNVVKRVNDVYMLNEKTSTYREKGFFGGIYAPEPLPHSASFGKHAGGVTDEAVTAALAMGFSNEIGEKAKAILEALDKAAKEGRFS